MVGPYRVADATALTDAALYSGRLTNDIDGTPCLLAFYYDDGTGGFVGTISDPMPVTWQTTAAGHRRLAVAPAAARTDH
jgi:beta-fructofuranosidase